MTDDLITCAAADAVFLVPLAESVAAALAAAARDALSTWAAQGAKARLLRATDVARPLVELLARGAQAPDGAVDIAVRRMGRGAMLEGTGAARGRCQRGASNGGRLEVGHARAHPLTQFHPFHPLSSRQRLHYWASREELAPAP